MSEDEPPADDDRPDEGEREPADSGDQPDPAGGPDASPDGTDQPSDDDPAPDAAGDPTDVSEAEIERLYERLAELEDEVEGQRASKASVAELREELESFEDDVESRTVDRDEVESDLKRYVRRKLRRGHARGWGPYLVLLYGTAMTLGLLYAPKMDGDFWVVFAMIVIWLSVLGLYVLFVIVGVTFSVLGVPGRLRDRVQEWRS
ncbi:ribonuclease BN [Haloarchaeobius amylolyticus]|uniref:ribonuclease BN n=1 Tax=Haloarchaeobius amylolyticus TaxID=1198296 RepID=UPI0022719544|nr:ribonuclease BN [Haloarchaeobius amylolyticus]